MKLAPLLSAAWLAVAAMPGAAEVIERQQSVRPLPGGLDSVLMVNDKQPRTDRGRRHPDLNLPRWEGGVGSGGAQRSLRPVQPPRVCR